MNLRERAAMAYLDREQQLATVACRALTDVLGELSIAVGKVSANLSATSLVELEADDLHFVVKITTTTIVAEGSNKGLEWDEDKVGVFCRNGGKEYPVLSLADLGQVFKDEYKNAEIVTKTAEGDSSAEPVS